MEIIGTYDTTIPIDIIKAISDTIHDHLIASRDTIHVTEAILRLRDNSRNHLDLSRSSSRFCFKDRRPRWNNEFTRTNPSLCNMSCIGCGSSQHTFADQK